MPLLSRIDPARSDVSQLCVSRKNDRRGLMGCENSVKSEENGLRDMSKTIWNYC